MGGIFSEGVDLPGERLIGVMIVGVGLPQLSLEREMIRDSLCKNESDGYAQSYIYPGFLRVQQAAGRLIRSPTDRGILLLIDERFLQPPYDTLFPDSWQHYETVSSVGEVETAVKNFWKGTSQLKSKSMPMNEL